MFETITQSKHSDTDTGKQKLKCWHHLESLFCSPWYIWYLSPIQVKFHILQHSIKYVIVHYHILLLVYNIWMRHNFLQKFIGTKEEEDISKINSVNVAIGFPVCLVVSSVLEVGFYFLYNRKVCHCMHRPFSSSTQHFSPKKYSLYTICFLKFHPWIKIIKIPAKRPTQSVVVPTFEHQIVPGTHFSEISIICFINY